MLVVKNINKSFRSKAVLKNVSFSVDRKQIAIFLGGSGVGKSTLLRVLNGLEEFDEGHIALDGAPIDHNIGLVFQHFNLFEHLSVEENITLALCKVKKMSNDAAKQVAKDLLERYGLADKKEARVSALSGGQKQRLAIARTLAMDPQVVCLDEPTSALDPQKTREVASEIIDISNDNRIVLLSTHDTQLLDLLDATIFLMEDGAIIESCTTRQYQSSPNSYTKLAQFLGK